MIGQDITILSSDWLSRQLQLNTTFHHELKDPLSQMVFRNVFRSAPCISVSTFILTSLFGLSSEPGLDMSSLARAAVAGDERALDLFSSWRPKTGRRGVHQVLYCTVLYCTILYCTRTRPGRTSTSSSAPCRASSTISTRTGAAWRCRGS